MSWELYFALIGPTVILPGTRLSILGPTVREDPGRDSEGRTESIP